MRSRRSLAPLRRPVFVNFTARVTSFCMRLLLAPLGLLLSAGAFAVSLGDELILSRLGDPVEVEIEVLQWEDMDLDRVQIAAASREEYEVFKLTWLPVLEHLNFNLIGPDLNGNVRVLVSSRDPLDEPFLELLLVLRWPGGSLRREYVLLFDPPGAPVAVAQPVAPAPEPEPRVAEVVEESAAPIEAPPLTAPVAPPQPAPPPPVVADVPEPVVEVAQPIADVPPPAVRDTPDETIASAPATPPAPETDMTVADARTQVAIDVETLAPQAASGALDTTRRTYQVRAGDSLWNIARQFVPAGASENIYQMLLGIHDLNRNSFINGNISLLKANALLQMPTETDIAAIDPATAQAEFDRRWEAGTQRFDAAQRGEAIPLFVGETVVDEPAAPVEPELPPGTEAPPPAADDGGLIMVSATSAAMPLQLAPAGDATIEQPAPAVGEVQDAPAPPIAAPQAPAVATTAVVTTTVELETEVAAMRARREAAEAVARQLQESLQRAQAERAAQTNLLAPQNLPLAAGALALVVALVAGVVFMLKIAGELRTASMGTGVALTAARPLPTRLAAVNPVRTEALRTEPTRNAASANAPEPPDARDPAQIEVIEMEADAANATMASADEGTDPDDLFARMDNMLGAAQKSPQK